MKREHHFRIIAVVALALAVAAHALRHEAYGAERVKLALPSKSMG